MIVIAQSNLPMKAVETKSQQLETSLSLEELTNSLHSVFSGRDMTLVQLERQQQLMLDRN